MYIPGYMSCANIVKLQTTDYSRSPQVLVGHLAKTTNQSLVQYTEEYKNTCVKECVKEHKYPGVCGTFVVRGTWYMVRGTCVYVVQSQSQCRFVVLL